MYLFAINRIQLEVCYFKADAEGFMERKDFTVIAEIGTPLRHSILQIPTLASQVTEDAEFKIVCQGDNSANASEMFMQAQLLLNLVHLVHICIG